MSIDVKGTWYNQHGSKLELRVGDGGQIDGIFEAQVGLVEPGESCPVRGFAVGDAVAFTVAFRRHHTVTTWTGHAAGGAGGARLETLWHMAAEFPPPRKPEELWKGTWSGADLFTREPPRVLATSRQPPHPLH